MTRGRDPGERWWPLTRDIGAAAIGTGIMVHQTVFAPHADPVLVAAALAFYGIPTSNVAVKKLARKLLNGNGNGERK